MTRDEGLDGVKADDGGCREVNALCVMEETSITFCCLLLTLLLN